MDRDRSVFVGVHLFEEKLDFVFGNIGVNVPQEIAKLRKVELLLVLHAHALQQFVEVDILGVDLETQFGHDHLQFILELCILQGILFEITFEDGMQEDVVPANSMVLVNLQALVDEILSIRTEHLIDFDRFGLDILDKFEFSLCGPWCFIMKELVEDEPNCPNIALGCVCL